MATDVIENYAPELVEVSTKDPFQFFELEISYQIDEDILRERYFKKCQCYQFDEVMLALTHENYQILQDPIKRLDYFLGKFERQKTNSYAITEDIMLLYQEVESLSAENAHNFILKIENLQKDLQKLIQESFEKKDIKKLESFRGSLAYYQKFLNEAYQKI